MLSALHPCALAASRQSFKEHEALVYQQLAQLIRDGVWLKSYIAAVMRVEQEAFTTAYNAMGPTKVRQICCSKYEYAISLHLQVVSFTKGSIALVHSFASLDEQLQCICCRK